MQIIVHFNRIHFIHFHYLLESINKGIIMGALNIKKKNSKTTLLFFAFSPFSLLKKASNVFPLKCPIKLNELSNTNFYCNDSITISFSSQTMQLVI